MSLQQLTTTARQLSMRLDNVRWSLAGMTPHLRELPADRRIRRRRHWQLAQFRPLERALRAYCQPNQTALSRHQWGRTYARRFKGLEKAVHQLPAWLRNDYLQPFALLDLPRAEGGVLLIPAVNWLTRLEGGGPDKQALRLDLVRGLSPHQRWLVSALGEVTLRGNEM